jgi:hypothetical protein
VKATEVRILKALEPGESYVDPTFLLVETGRDDSGDTVTTIEHVTGEVVNGKQRWQIATLGQSVPLTHAAALEWAVSFAASRNVPIVYERDDTLNANYAAALSAGRPAAASSTSK